MGNEKMKTEKEILSEMLKILIEVITEQGITTSRTDWAQAQLKKIDNLFSKLSEIK